MRDRFIAVSVAMRGHPVVGHDVPPPPPADKSRHALAPMLAFQDCLAEAAWKRRAVRDKDRVLTLERGQFRAGRSFWAKRWNWGEKSVRSFFAKLEAAGIIAISGQSAGHYTNVATLCNYDKYQSPEEVEGEWSGQRRASDGPVPGQNLTKTTKDTNNTTPFSPTGSLAAEDVRKLVGRLEELAGDALANPAASAGLLNYSAVVAWLDSGADPEKDIVPAVIGVAGQAHKSGKRIRTWDYFSAAVAENVARRKQGLQASQVTTRRAFSAGPTVLDSAIAIAGAYS